MMVRFILVAIVVGIVCAHTSPALAQSLRGSQASLERQQRVAQEHNYTFLRDPAHVQRFVRLGLLVPVKGNADYELAGVSFPYARPELKLFIERLARQYRNACKEKLVVTSLTRPLSHQPKNASARSVHPTGMAVDLRMSRNPSCRSWLERVLLDLEKAGVLDAIKEHRPPHYHIALFPNAYSRYVARLENKKPESTRRIASSFGVTIYRVNEGDTLWGLARRYGTTVETLREVNGLASDVILPGQLLKIPAR